MCPRLALAAATAVLALLAGCATVSEPVPVADPEAVWQARQARLAELDRWTAVGRVGIRAGDEAANLSLYWRQRAAEYVIRLNAPLGQGTVELAGGEAGVVMRTSKEDVWAAESPEALLRQRLGWSMPVSGLRYWILGRPQPGHPVSERELDAAGRAEGFRQAGWEIRYLRYGEADSLALPTKVFVERDGVSARLVVSRWEVDERRHAAAE